MILLNASAPIVIIEEDANDLELIERRIRGTGATHPMNSFSYGDDALNYLVGLITSGIEPLPWVMFTDVKLIGSDGFEVIERVRRHPELRHMKIFVLTGSENPEHRTRASELRVDGYLIKFPSTQHFAQILAG